MKYEYVVKDCIHTEGEDENGKPVRITAIASLKNTLDAAAAEGWRVVEVLPAVGYVGYLAVLERVVPEEKKP